MQQLEAKARQLAEESLQEKAAADKKLLFVRFVYTVVSVFHLSNREILIASEDFK